MPNVTDNAAAGRFEMRVDEHLTFIVYQRKDGVISLNHAEVPPALEGRGIGSKLVRGTLDLIRADGMKVIPRCPFVAAFVAKNPEYADLLAR